MWDSIITDRKISANRPDAVIHDLKSKTCLLIDVSVADDKNIALKEADLQDLDIEINRTSNVKTKVVPELGTLGKDFTKGVESIPGRPKVLENQKRFSSLGTAHIILYYIYYIYYMESAWMNH